MTTLDTPPTTSTPAATTPAAPAKRSSMAGLLPFIGIILFTGSTVAYLLGGDTTDWKQTLLTNAVVYLIGWAMLGAGISHLFFGRRISKSIGFEKSPYELEVGFADLAMGIVGLMAASYGNEFLLAIILASSIYRVGCGFGHIRSMIVARNFAINNTAILVINFAVPIFLVVAYLAWS